MNPARPRETALQEKDSSMPSTLTRPRSPLFRGLFPDWSGPQPFHFYLMEQLLEARSQSPFPTNGAGPDEDVNVYLAHLLTGFLTGAPDFRVGPGSDPLLHPPSKNSPRGWRSEWYRVNGDHRLIYQGLFDRGDGLRRRRIEFGRTEEETRKRDRMAGAFCYRAAADVLEHRSESSAGLVAVLRKLDRHYDDYIQVLTVLATRRLGLGARLSDTNLSNLLRPAPDASADRELSPSMDDFLDALVEYNRTKNPGLKSRLLAMAETLDIEPNGLFAGPDSA
jgi:hypothetical protein